MIDTLELQVNPPCWRLSPVDLGDFLRHAYKFVQEGAVFRLESGGAKEIESFMANRPAKYPNERQKSWFLIFKTAKVFYMPVTKENFEGLAELSENYAEPEVGNALGIYINGELILSWHDLPDDPIYVSTKVAESTVSNFCSLLSCEYTMET